MFGPGALRFSLAFAVLLIVPGYLMMRALRLRGLDVVEQAVLAMSLSLLALVPATAVAYLWELSLQAFLGASFGTMALLLAVLVARRIRGSRDLEGPPRQEWWSIENTTLLALTLGLSALGGALIYSFPRYVATGWDVFEHIAAVRKLLELPRISSYDGAIMNYFSGTVRDYAYSYNLWELVTAAIVRASRTDLLHSWRALAVVLVPFTLASKYFLARSLFGEEHRRVAWMAAIVYWVYKFVYTTARTETIYLQFLNQPGPMNAEVLMPVALGCFFLFARGRPRIWLWLGALLVGTLLWIHPVEWFNTLALLSVSAALLWGWSLVSRDRVPAWRMTWSALAAVAGGVVTLAVPVKWYVYATSPIPTGGFISALSGSTYIRVLGDRVIHNPEYGFADKIVTLGLLCLIPLLWSRAVPPVTKALCAAAPVLLALLSYNPLLTGFIISKLSVVVAQRAYEGPVWVMLVAFAASSLIEPVVADARGRFRRVGQAGLALVGAGIVLMTCTLTGTAPAGLPGLISTYYRGAQSYVVIDEFARSPIVEAVRQLPPGAEVFTDRSTGLQMPAFAPIYVNAFDRDVLVADGPKRSEDAREALSANTPFGRALDIVRSYGSEYVLLSKRGGSRASAWKFDSLFTRLYRDPDWALFRTTTGNVEDIVWIDLMSRLKEARVTAPDNALRNGGAKTEPAGAPARESVAAFSPSRIEFTLALTSRPLLRVGAAMEPTSYVNNCSDGACFAVEVADAAGVKQVFSLCLTAKTVERDTSWHDSSVDLGPYAGQSVKVALVTTGGPSGSTSCDYAYWSTLILQQGRK